MAEQQMALDIDVGKLNRTIICYAKNIYRFNGVWEGPDPLTPLISFFLIQLTISIGISRLMVMALKPFNQPPSVAEILGGILLGPSALGRLISFRKLLFPDYSFQVLEPIAHLSIVYHAFLVGLKMDVRGILPTGPKAMKVAVAGIIIPFSVGSGLYFISKPSDSENAGCLFWGGVLTVTSFSVLTKILEQQHLLHTEIGKTAMASALINDMCAWVFLALGFAVTGSEYIHMSLIFTISFVLFCIYYLRPILRWIIRKTPEGQGYSEFYVCSVLTGVALCGVVTDMLGTHPIIGALIFGLMIPNDVLEATLVDKLEDFVVGIMMPVFYLVCGMKTNIDLIFNQTHWLVVCTVIVLACSVKVFSTLLVSILSNFSIDEAMAIGMLSNTKNIMAMIILEAGQIQKALNAQTYSLMVVAVLIMTMIVTPAAIKYRPVKNIIPYKRRTLQKANSDEELRVLGCIYNTRVVPAIISLLRTSNATQRSPIRVFALQLVELVGRASAMLVVHDARKAGHRNPSHIEAQADQIISYFDNFELRSEGVTTQVLTARCAYATMDDDICNIAKDMRAAFIIIPFHKQQTIDGEMEDINSSIRGVNEGVLANAPCSVGILVDRGFAESHDHSGNIAVLFLGGPDDREALAYAWRMVDNTNAKLTVVRFIPSTTASELDHIKPVDKSHLILEIDSEREKLMDDDFLSKFKSATMNNKFISYYELVLNDEEEAVKAIKSMDEHKYDLYMVGRGRGMVSPLTAGLTDWCDCPELGPIGDLLVTSEFESAFSVLIVQQYIKTNSTGDGLIRSSSSVSYNEELAMRPSDTESDGFETFSNFRRDEDN